jgi:hypothetical protein
LKRETMCRRQILSNSDSPMAFLRRRGRVFLRKAACSPQGFPTHLT